MSKHLQKPQTMSRDAAGWKLRRVVGSVAAVIVMGATVTLATVSVIDSAPAAGSAPVVTVTPGENNWG